MLVGIDIGSRTIKTAAIKDGRLHAYQVKESGFSPHLQSLEMIQSYHPTKIVATGYGRHLAQKHFAGDVITEIKAHALGARYYFPSCRTVLDVGGQDSKVIALDERGKVANFQMNDKCAAGTGRFLEIMAASLGIPLADFGSEALEGSEDIKITSMCTVFAESEVVSLKNHGASPRDIARAVHLSVVERLSAMLHRIGFEEAVVFTGGVARNRAIVQLLRDKLEIKVLVPDEPDIVGALGAALHAL
ncbi:MAG TPA: acyl-CoA dehydratase activase [Nitrospirota bacterium]|nr:acyl-CoA dehydratase activase [Nitrospirota bacterium]